MSKEYVIIERKCLPYEQLDKNNKKLNHIELSFIEEKAQWILTADEEKAGVPMCKRVLTKTVLEEDIPCLIAMARTYLNEANQNNKKGNE